MPVPIDLFFLGTGAAVPTLKRMHSSILFRRGADHFLFDCGEAAQLGLLKAGVSPMKISRVFISHWHADHFAGLLPLMETMNLEGRKEPLHVYGPEASRFVDALLELSYYGVGFPLRATDVPADKPELVHKSPDYEIFSVPVKHNVPAVGYLFGEKPHWKINPKKAEKLGLEPGPLMSRLHEKGKIKLKGKTINLGDVATEIPGRKIAYSGDTLAHEPFFRAVAGADLLVHDGTFVEPAEGKSHAAAAEVSVLAKKYRIKRLVLTHVSRRYSDPAELLKAAKSSFNKVSVARDGMRITL